MNSGKFWRMAAFARPAVAAAVAVAASTAMADEPYTGVGMRLRFDEQAPGYVFDSTGPGVITNDNNNATTLYTYAIAGTTMGTEPAECMPRYTTPFQGMRIYDPMIGKGWMNRSALRFTATSGGYNGGSVVMKSDALSTSVATHDALTDECFVCTTSSVFNTFAPIFGKKNRKDESSGADFSTESWALYMTTAGNLAARFTTVDANTNATTYLSKSSSPYGQGKAINDGKWHHVAMTYDMTDGLCRVYVDYVEQFSKEDPDKNPIYYSTSYEPESTAIYIGGYPFASGSQGRKFDGCIDEFRLCFRALTPNEFLRIEPQDRDELLRLRMDPHSYFGADLNGTANYSTIYYNRNYTYAFRSDVLQALYTDCGGTASLDDGESYAASIRDGFFGAPAADYGSLSLATNSAGKSGYMKATSLTTRMTGGNVETNMDYTVEAFFKTRTTETAQGPRTVYTLGTWPVAGVVLNNTSEGRVCCTWNDGKSWRRTYSTETTANDGNWHHVATVCDAAKKRMRFYYDGKLTAVSNDVNNVIQTGSSLFVGSNTSGANGFDGWIDDVRVTMRALKPGEFLTATGADPEDSDDPTIMLAGFEGDFTTVPYPALTGTGEGSAHTGGSCAAPEFIGKRYTYALDGSNGVDKVKSFNCVKFSGSQIVWPYSPVYEQDSFTVEFFANISRLDNGASPVRYIGGTDSLTAGPIWALWQDTGAAGGANTLALGIQLLKDGVTATDYSTKWPEAAELGDWHHYALTVAPKDGTNTVVEMFRDYASLGAFELQGRLDYSAAKGGRLAMGAGADSNRVYGLFDMLRFSKGVLTPEKFIANISGGTMIVLK